MDGTHPSSWVCLKHRSSTSFPSALPLLGPLTSSFPSYCLLPTSWSLDGGRWESVAGSSPGLLLPEDAGPFPPGPSVVPSLLRLALVWGVDLDPSLCWSVKCGRPEAPQSNLSLFSFPLALVHLPFCGVCGFSPTLHSMLYLSPSLRLHMHPTLP